MNFSHSTDKNVILSEAYRQIIHKMFGDKKQLCCCFFPLLLDFEIITNEIYECKSLKPEKMQRIILQIMCKTRILFGEYLIQFIKNISCASIFFLCAKISISL